MSDGHVPPPADAQLCACGHPVGEPGPLCLMCACRDHRPRQADDIPRR